MREFLHILLEGENPVQVVQESPFLRCGTRYIIQSYAIAPPPPSNVGVSVESSTNLRVTWTIPSAEGVTGFFVAFSPVPGECAGVEGGNVTLGSDASSHTLHALGEFVEYEVTVQSQGVDGIGIPSSAMRGKTQRASKDSL